MSPCSFQRAKGHSSFLGLPGSVLPVAPNPDKCTEASSEQYTKREPSALEIEIEITDLSLKLQML